MKSTALILRGADSTDDLVLLGLETAIQYTYADLVIFINKEGWPTIMKSKIDYDVEFIDISSLRQESTEKR